MALTVNTPSPRIPFPAVRSDPQVERASRSLGAVSRGAKRPFLDAEPTVCLPRFLLDRDLRLFGVLGPSLERY